MSKLGTFIEAVVGQQSLPIVDYHFSTTDGPEAHWQVRRVQLREALSEPYSLFLDLVTDELGTDTEALLGASGELTFDRDTLSRPVCGIISVVEFIGTAGDRLQVRVELVPALQLLGQRVDTRLWQDLTVPEVVQEVLEAGLADYEREVDLSGLTGNYANRALVVQYHESDLDFVNRLLEAEGITYWFDHDRGEGKEVLVLEDSNDNVVDVHTIDDQPEIHVVVDRAEQAEVETIQRFDWTRELSSTAVYQRTFDWQTPITPVEANSPEHQAGVDDRGSTREVYHHGRFVEDDPTPRTVRRLVHRQAHDRVARGVANVSGMTPGRKFTILGHERDDLEGEYLIRSVVHEGDCADVLSGEASEGPRYQCRFECVVFDTELPTRPVPRTPRPKIYGPQTAIVTGPAGEEIHTDEYGRIKVRFDWDRQHALDDDTSAWIRVAHNWSGPGFGSFFLPRVGMEVLVEFLEGNPDQPLVVGCVYNGDNQASVDLPGHKTQTTIRTKSSPDSDGYNELRFEDAAGHEEVFLRAQRQLTEQVLHSHSTSVGANQSNSVGGNQSNSVTGNQSNAVDKDQAETVTGKQTMKVGGIREKTITGDETNKLEASRKSTVGADERLEVVGTTTIISDKIVTLTCKADYKQTVGGAIGSIKADKNFELVAQTKLSLGQAEAATVVLEGGAATHGTNKAFEVTAGTDLKLHATGGELSGDGSKKVEFTQGGATITLEGNKVAISSASEITLSVGGSTIKLDPAGVTISGTKIDVAASGITTIAGSMVKVN